MNANYIIPEEKSPLDESFSRKEVAVNITPELAKRIEEYEARIEAKRERYAERAAKHEAAATARMNEVDRIASAIPPGQPILVDHYSAGRHRRDIARMDSGMRAAVEHDKTAAHYAEKAANYGNHGISSDDPAAILKLKEKLASMEETRTVMKRINAYYRKHKTLDGCPDLTSIQIAQTKHAMEKDWRTNPKPFETYQFSNLTANIHRVENRIKVLSAAAERGNVEQEKDKYTYREDVDENRVMFLFPGKPDEETRTLLKRHGFKWSPRRSAWVRQLNANGKYAAKLVMEVLDKVRS